MGVAAAPSSSPSPRHNAPNINSSTNIFHHQRHHHPQTTHLADHKSSFTTMVSKFTSTTTHRKSMADLEHTTPTSLPQDTIMLEGNDTRASAADAPQAHGMVACAPINPIVEAGSPTHLQPSGMLKSPSRPPRRPHDRPKTKPGLHGTKHIPPASKQRRPRPRYGPSSKRTRKPCAPISTRAARLTAYRSTCSYCTTLRVPSSRTRAHCRRRGLVLGLRRGWRGRCRLLA